MSELVKLLQRKAPEYLELMAGTEREFNKALDAMLEKAVDHLERNARNFDSLGEVGLTGVLAAALSLPGLSVTQEPNSNGHVDLKVVAEHSHPMRTVLGEAKIYNGPNRHFEGLEQLLGYMTGREARGLLIAFVKKAGTDTLVKKLRKRMNAERPKWQKGPTKDHLVPPWFTSKHRHRNRRDVEACHIFCDLG